MKSIRQAWLLPSEHGGSKQQSRLTRLLSLVYLPLDLFYLASIKTRDRE